LRSGISVAIEEISRNEVLVFVIAQRQIKALVVIVQRDRTEGITGKKVKALKKNISLKSRVDKEVGINLTDIWFFLTDKSGLKKQ
jgi:hypothetical protein